MDEYHFEGWSSDRYEGGLNFFKRQKTDLWALFDPNPIRYALFKPFLVKLGYENCNMVICQL